MGWSYVKIAIPTTRYYSPANLTLTCESLASHENMLLCISGWEAVESLGMELAVRTWLQLLIVHTSKCNVHTPHTPIFTMVIINEHNYDLGGKAQAFMKLYTPCCIDSTAMTLPLYSGLLNPVFVTSSTNVATTINKRFMLGSKGLATRLPYPITLTLTLSIAVLMWLLQETNTGVRKLLPCPRVTFSHWYQCAWLWLPWRWSTNTLTMIWIM